MLQILPENSMLCWLDLQRLMRALSSAASEKYDKYCDGDIILYIDETESPTRTPNIDIPLGNNGGGGGMTDEIPENIQIIKSTVEKLNFIILVAPIQ